MTVVSGLFLQVQNSRLAVNRWRRILHMSKVVSTII